MSQSKHDDRPQPEAGSAPGGVVSSRIPGFYKLGVDERLRTLTETIKLSPREVELLGSGCLTVEQANHMVENVVGTYSLPLGLGLNFQVNGRDYLVPMCVEEPSVIAAA